MFRLDDELYAFIVRPDALEVWKHEEVRRRLSWYYSVMRGEKPPKYLIVKSVGIPRDIGALSDLDLESLNALHGEMRKEFLGRWNRIRDGSESLKDYPQVNK